MSANNTVLPPAQLGVVKTPDNGTFTPESQVSFTIVVSNTAPPGSQLATNVTLSDQLPGNGGLVWSSASTTQGSCTTPIVDNLLNCTLGPIPPQGSVTVTVTSGPTTPAAACQSQPNPVALAAADNGLSAQDSGSLICTPPAPPQLSVVKTPDNGTFTPGSQVSFTIVVSNLAASGSQSATNVTLSDQLPGNGGLVWSSASPTQGSCTPIVGNLLNCALGTIAPQGSVTVTVTSGPTTPAAACQSQPNPVALATADNGLTAQDSGSLTCTPPALPQLSVVKTPDNGTFAPGAQVSFTIVVRNPSASGSQPATNVTLSDQLPGNGGLVWSSASPTQGSCTLTGGNLLNCALGTIAPQGSVTVTVTSGPTTPAAACQSQPNPVALATADNGLSAQDSGSLTCTPPASPQLSVVKTPDNGTFAPGAQVSFTIVVRNPSALGSQPATNVTLSDQLPGNGGLVWSSASTTHGSCTTPIGGNLLNCALGTIPPQGSVTVTVTSGPTTPAAACQSQPNPVALATADNGLTAQDSGSLTCTPPVPPQLSVVKTPDNGSFAPGAQVSFTIVVRNPSALGSPSATNVTLSDQLPGNGGLVWSSASPTQGSCTPIVGNLLNCALGTIPPQGSVTVTVTSGPTTPAAACQSQPNPVALAAADNGLSAQDSGSLTCGAAPPPGAQAIPGPGIIATALAFLLGAFAFGGWRKQR